MRKSYIWAIVITVAIAGWLASGQVIVGGQGESAVTAPNTQDGNLSAQSDAAGDATKPFRVRVGTLTSVDRTAELKVRGRTEAAERVMLRAQTPGLVEQIPVSKGQRVATGDVICKLEAGSRTANILRAEAGLAQAELDYDAASKLNEKGYAAETRVRAAKAAMHAAKAVLSEARLDLERTKIKASFDGVVDDLPAKIGTLLNVGDPCAEIVAADSGIGAMMMRAKRFVHIDEIMAGIITIGLLGLLFDILLRRLRRVLFPYLVSGD